MAKPQRVLLVVNPVARTVTRPVVEVIEKALAADFKLDVHETNARGHATELAREAVQQGSHMVVVFSGDGTINEAVNAIAGTDLSLGIIPGGATNVLARGLGIPTDPVEATVFLLHRVEDEEPRLVNLGNASGRYFAFSCGAGLDAAAMSWLDRRADRLRSKRSYEWAALYAVLREGLAHYAGREPDLSLSVEGGPATPSVTVLVANSRPYAYFKRWGLKATPGASIHGGLDVLSARRISRKGVPRLAWQLFVTAAHTRSRHMDYHHDVEALEVTGRRPFPVQVDGDYLGLRDRLSVTLSRDALRVYA